jgi:hypothetical protein
VPRWAFIVRGVLASWIGWYLDDPDLAGSVCNGQVNVKSLKRWYAALLQQGINPL